MLSVEMRYENIPMIGGLVTNYESVETIQIGGYANYTTFIYKIAEDVYKKKYLENPVISAKDAGNSWKVFNDLKGMFNQSGLKNCYKLAYKTPLYWIKEINILILNEHRKRARGVSYPTESDVVNYNNKTIEYATILLINPRKEYDIKKALFHEMRHYFIDYNRYINTGYTLSDPEFYENFFADYKAIRSTISSDERQPFRIKRDDKGYVEQIYNDDINITVSHLRIVLYYIMYYLNVDEISANKENLFIELEDFKKHHPYERMSIDNLYLIDNSPILLQYLKIKKILNYIINNTSDEIANIFKMKHGNTFYNMMTPLKEKEKHKFMFFDKHSNYEDDDYSPTLTLHNVCKKLLNKWEKVQKHWLKILDYTEKYV